MDISVGPPNSERNPTEADLLFFVRLPDNGAASRRGRHFEERSLRRCSHGEVGR